MSDHQNGDSVFRSSLNEMRQQNFLCDLTLVADHMELPVHRNVLAAGSPYFRERFAAALQSGEPLDRLHLKGVQAVVLPALVEHLYTGRVLVNDSRICALLDAATELRLPAVREACLKRLGDQLQPDTCLRIRRLADLYDSEALRRRADTFVERHGVTLGDDGKKESGKDSEEDSTMFCKTEEIAIEQGATVGTVEAVNDKVGRPARSPPFEEIAIEDDPTVDTVEAVNDKAEVMMIIGQDGGGRNRGVCFDFVDNRWYEVENMPDAGMCIGAVVIDSLVYVISWCATGSRADIYNPAADTWQPLPEIDLDNEIGDFLRASSIVAHGHCIYFVGLAIKLIDAQFRRFTKFGQMSVFNVRTRRWLKDVVSMSEPRFRCGVAVLGDHLYVVGGEGTATVERYDVSANQWQTIAPMSTNRWFHACAVMDGLLYVTGGFVQWGSVDKGMEVYDPVADRWRRLTYHEHKLGHLGALAVVPHGGELYSVKSGFCGAHLLTQGTMAYAPATNTWRTVQPQMPLVLDLVESTVVSCLFDRPVKDSLPPSIDQEVETKKTKKRRGKKKTKKNGITG